MIQHIDASKKAIAMDKEKYNILKTSLIKSLKFRKRASFEEILSDVINDLKREKKIVAGSVQWNLAWVEIDMEAKNELIKDTSVFPETFYLK